MATRSSKTGGADGTDGETAGRERLTEQAEALIAGMRDEADAGPDDSPAAQAATVVSETAVVAGPEVKKKDLIERIVARSGLKRRDVKPAVEAMLEELAAAVQAGEELNLPPFGKLKITRSKDLANARVYHCRLRQPEAGPPAASDPLAEDDEEG